MEQFFRPRRLRRSSIIRDLCAEHTLRVDGLIQPYFVCDGSGIKDEINGLPGIYRESVDSLVKSVSDDLRTGVSKIMLFGVTDRKDAKASTAKDDRNPVILATKQLKDNQPEK